jgi:hypothetical protein
MVNLKAQEECIRSKILESHRLIATNNIYKLVLSQSAGHEHRWGMQF